MGHGLDKQAHAFALEAVAVTGMSVAVQRDDSNSDAGEKFSSEYLQKKAYFGNFSTISNRSTFVLRIGENFTGMFVS